MQVGTLEVLPVLDGSAAGYCPVDFADVADVLERVCVEHDQVRSFAGLDRARVGDAEQFCRYRGRGTDGVERS